MSVEASANPYFPVGLDGYDGRKGLDRCYLVGGGVDCDYVDLLKDLMNVDRFIG